jgi:hypothetical protein
VAGAAANALVQLARRFPETRDAVVAALTRQLRWWARHDPALNNILVAELVELAAVEAAPVMEEVYAAGAVDTWYAGDWEDVQVALGLLPERITAKPVYVPPTWRSSTLATRGVAGASRPKSRPKARKKARPRNHRRR